MYCSTRNIEMLSTVGIVTFRKERSVAAKSLSEVSALVSLTFYEIFLIRQEKSVCCPHWRVSAYLPLLIKFPLNRLPPFGSNLVACLSRDVICIFFNTNWLISGVMWLREEKGHSTSSSISYCKNSKDYRTTTGELQTVSVWDAL